MTRDQLMRRVEAYLEAREIYRAALRAVIDEVIRTLVRQAIRDILEPDPRESAWLGFTAAQQIGAAEAEEKWSAPSPLIIADILSAFPDYPRNEMPFWRDLLEEPAEIQAK